MHNTVIANAMIYDGTGRDGFNGSVLIDGDRIAAVTVCAPHAAEVYPGCEVIDAHGLALCPGFIDIHRHLDMRPLDAAWDARVELAQGITTAVAGNCGISLTPVSAEHADEFYAFAEPVLGPRLDGLPHTTPEYIQRLHSVRLPLNIGVLVGTGSTRIAVNGFGSAFPQAAKQRARAMIREALDAGALGASVGIMYLPECYGSAGEFTYMLQPLAQAGKPLTAHIRGEGDSLIKSIDEILEIAERVGCPLEISHFKSCGIANWRREIFRAIERIDSARARGMDVTCDFYPYEGGSNALTTMLPPVFVAGDMEGTLKRLGTRAGVAEFRAAVARQYDDWDNYALSLGWARVIISAVTCPENLRFLGKSVESAAHEFGFDDAPACAAYLMHAEAGRTSIITMSMCQDDIDTIAKLEYACVISDSIYNKTDTPHPRMYGAFPRIIREYVRERHIYTLPEAIHRMTAQPAARLNMRGRGSIAPGSFADLLLFDPAVFADTATFAQPASLATGLSRVFVNGHDASALAGCPITL